MLDLATVLSRAKRSAFYRNLLNWGLSRLIPFNKPHRFKVLEIADDRVKILLPYRKRNLNHIRGLHACALATLTEFTCGLLLIVRLGMSKYRIILQRLTMDYHYQGKTDAVAEFRLTDEWMDLRVYKVLSSQESVVISCEVKIYDINGNHLTTGVAEWQLKQWDKVKTKLKD